MKNTATFAPVFDDDDPLVAFRRSLSGSIGFSSCRASAIYGIEHLDFPDPLIEPFLESKIFDDVSYTDFVPILPLHDARLASVHLEFVNMSREIEGGRAWWDSLPLPFDFSVFEFRMNDFRVGMFVNGPRQAIAAVVEVVKGHWVPLAVTSAAIPKAAPPLDATEKPLTAALFEGFQEAMNLVYAASVTLDIGVAGTDVIEAPQKLNRSRERRGRVPLADYHVVRLHPKYATVAARDHPDGDIRRSVRMHAVRGHWRHWQDHRSWVKWHFRGDPALGFVRKHYEI